MKTLRLFRTRQDLLKTLRSEIGSTGGGTDRIRSLRALRRLVSDVDAEWETDDPVPDHTLRLGAQYRHPPSWITSVILAAKDESLDRDDVGEGKFLEYIKEADSTIDDRGGELIFRMLADGGKVEFETLRRSMSQSRVGAKIRPFSSDEYGSGGTVYSTIHASKGLEAERVEVGLWNWNWKGDNDPEVMTRNECLGEARVLYVAATRAKEELVPINVPTPPFLAGNAGTRIRGANSKGKWDRKKEWSTSIQFGGGYVEFGKPDDIGTTYFDRHFEQLQDTLSEHPGKPVKCHLRGGWIHRTHDDALLGRASAQYMGRPTRFQKAHAPEIACRFRSHWDKSRPSALKDLSDLVWYGNKSCSPEHGATPAGLTGRWREAGAYHVPLVYGLGKV